MRNNWFIFVDLDGGSPYIFPADPTVSHSFGGHLLSQIGSFVDNVHESRHLYVPGSLAVEEAFNCILKVAGALIFRFASGSNLRHKISGNPHGSKAGRSQTCSKIKHITSCKHNLAGLLFSKSRAESTSPVLSGKIVSSTMRQIWKEVEQLQSFPVLSLAAALVPPFDNFSPKVLAVPLENNDVQINGRINHTPCVCEHREPAHLSFQEINWARNAVEPKTGIQFPTVLENLTEQNSSSFTSEVLVGTGFRSMKIIKVKSLNVYAFGLYVHPDSLCEKLCLKYASVPVGELNERPEFCEDLIREDIHMTVRLVINCNGLKINTVRNAFEKSLRARLLKRNPNTDYHCLSMFGSYFIQDIPLHAGTTIDFRRTVDGQLITEICGKQIGAVRSKDLCMAFFDMYLGDVPVSTQAKEEICRNIGSIIRRC